MCKFFNQLVRFPFDPSSPRFLSQVSILLSIYTILRKKLCNDRRDILVPSGGVRKPRLSLLFTLTCVKKENQKNCLTHIVSSTTFRCKDHLLLAISIESLVNDKLLCQNIMIIFKTQMLEAFGNGFKPCGLRSTVYVLGNICSMHDLS